MWTKGITGRNNRLQEFKENVYMLWHFPSLIHTFTTWPLVFPKITGGADLMLPGVVLKNGAHINAFGKLQKGDRVAVNLTSNKAPFAVGKAALSSFDMYMSAKRGKGVQILHFVGDHLWSWGTKLTIPDLGPPEEFLDSAPSIDEDASYNGNNTNVSTPDEIHVINDVMSSTIQGPCDTNLPGEENISTDVPIEITNLDTIAVSLTQQSLDDGQEDGDQEEPDPQEDMDNLISYCFMKAWKTTAKNIELPLLTSNFFKLHMIPACPVGQSIDLKKSSFKKLSKFLSELEQKDLIKVKELTKGVVSIVSVNREHKLFREFRLNEPAPDPKQMIEMKGGKSVKPEITEMYVVTAAVFPVLAEYLVKKGDNLPLTSIRKYVTEYVRVRKLQDNQNRRLVKLDATLQSCLQVPQEVTALSWEELTTKFISQMTHSYQVTFSGENKVVAKGKLEPIDIQIGKRSGNKKVTLINNLELYGVNLQEFGRECQHGVAASTSISSVPGRKTPQLLVQGNQVDFVGKLLMGKYEIPKRYIRGLENAPKNKK
ncbi:unnamed protein product [Timema podura]|uniref:Ligatin n=1 Tax=Timema podura TaxID=61482 RepID=A0ABN7NJZ6_TIMPD|nr:unnamed protein product [Timema podura]